jgi:hypothetical protein
LAVIFNIGAVIYAIVKQYFETRRFPLDGLNQAAPVPMKWAIGAIAERIFYAEKAGHACLIYLQFTEVRGHSSLHWCHD